MNLCLKARILISESHRYLRDEEVDLGSGQPIGGSDREFGVSGTRYSEAAVPGEWRI